MRQKENAMDFARAFSYIFEDSEWLKKVGIAALVMLIPFLGPITVLGWSLAVTKRLAEGQTTDLLPGWDNFSDHMTLGFKAFVVGFAYSLPVVLISSCTNVLPIIAQEMRGDMYDVMMIITSVVSICFGCFTFLYSIALGLFLPAAYAQVAVTGEVAAGFRFGEILALVKAAIGAYVLVLVGSIAAGFVATLGIIACVIGVIFTAALAYAIMGHFYGQAYNTAKAAAPAA
jgi:hypothetical protein